jgi:hypothetical protein
VAKLGRIIIALFLVVVSVSLSGCLNSGGAETQSGDSGVTVAGRNWTMATANAEFGPRNQYSAVVFDGKMWVIGGFDNEAGFRNDIWSSPDGRQWTQVNASVGFLNDRLGQSAVAFKDKIWIIGGYDGKKAAGEIWYSEDGIIWKQATPMAEFGPRTQVSTVVFNDQVWLIGGTRDFGNYQYLQDVWHSNDGISWTLAAPQGPLMPYMRRNLVVLDDKIWAFGVVRDLPGKPGSKRNEIWYSKNGKDWKLINSQNLFPPRDYPNPVVFDNKLWIIGGRNTSGYNVNDVWYSTNGYDWKEATPAADFSFDGKFYSLAIPLAFDNKMWVIRTVSEDHRIRNDVWFTGDSQSLVRGKQ